MRLSWAIPATLLLAVSLAADSGRDAVTNALARLDADTAKLSTDMRDRVQLDAAQTLTERFPDLARKYVSAVLADVKQHSPIEADASLLSALAAAAPQETVALLPKMKPGSDAMLASALLRADQVDLAVRVYRASLEHGPVHPSAAAALLARLAKEKPRGRQPVPRGDGQDRLEHHRPARRLLRGGLRVRGATGCTRGRGRRV